MEAGKTPPTKNRINYGRRLLPSLIDEKACSVPNEPYCYLPWSSKIEDGFRTISFQGLANAINACSWWIQAELGKGEDFSTLAYLGPSDLRNIIIIVAAIKAGHKVVPCSRPCCENLVS